MCIDRRHLRHSALVATAVAFLGLSGCGGGSTDTADTGIQPSPPDGMMPPGGDTGPPVDLSQFLTPAIDAGAAPGAVVAIIDEDGVRAIGAAGVRRQGSPEAITTDDLIYLRSTNKAMTSTMLATMVDDGTFANGWNTTIGEVFPELVGSIHQDYQSVTVAQLVRMRGGLAREAADWRAYANNPDLADRRYNILRDNLANTPAGAVGDFGYSNLSYMVAGAMAERVTGKNWQTLMQERLFAPLGITTARYGLLGTAGGVDQPWGHTSDGSGGWTPIQTDDPRSAGVPWGSDLHMSVEDWAKFISLWFTNKAPAILDRNTLNQLRTPERGRYAAGWYVDPHRWAGEKVIHHGGRASFWRVWVYVAPERGLAYVWVANAADADDSVADAFNAIVGNFVTNENLPGGATQAARDHEIQIARDDGVSVAALRNGNGGLAGLKVGDTALSLDFHRLGGVTGGGGRESVGSVINSENVIVRHIDTRWNTRTDAVARFDHMSYGAWATGIAVPRPGGGADYTYDDVGGAYLTALDDARTPAAAMPMSGTATYQGQSTGFVQGHGVGGRILHFTADIEMTADFANAAMTVDMLTTRGTRYVLGGSIQGNGFSGTTIHQMPQSSLIETQGATAQMTGGFYGTDAVEAGGVYEVVGGRAQDPGRVVGAFGGRRDP